MVGRGKPSCALCIRTKSSRMGFIPSSSEQGQKRSQVTEPRVGFVFNKVISQTGRSIRQRSSMSIDTTTASRSRCLGEGNPIDISVSSKPVFALRLPERGGRSSMFSHRSPKGHDILRVSPWEPTNSILPRPVQGSLLVGCHPRCPFVGGVGRLDIPCEGMFYVDVLGLNMMRPT